jgi:ADP-ribosylglycohydrolase
MGDVTEGWSYQEIEAKWGVVDTLLPQNKFGKDGFSKDGTVSDWVLPQAYGPDFYYHGHTRPPGMTEDGHERHRLCVSAIIKKGGRINLLDLAKTWLEDIDPSKFGYVLGPQDQVIYYSIKAGVPPWEIGKFASWPGLIGTSKMILPIGMVNACYPDRAAQDALELGRLKDTRGVSGNYAIEVCSAIAAACAEAMKPNATVDSVIETALFYLSKKPKAEVELGLSWAKNADSWKDLRPLYAEKYEGFSMSNAVEVLSGGLACFYMAGGKPKEALLYAVNLGRDCDCKAYVAGGLAGALRGIEEVPTDWLKIIEEQVVTDPYTVSTRSYRESAEGLYKAAIHTMNEMSVAVDLLKELTK